MDWQNALVGVILLAAFVYVGKMAYFKIRTLSSKPGCGGDCGCESSPKNKKLTQIT